ncbi:MAG TPA: P-loop NTPase fold protein, partial [Kofleriaceae bacterium]|nr:P-loop NTPase fold protein [Kofleriaceae bacterium]
MTHIRAANPLEAFDAFNPQLTIAPEHPWYADIESFFDPARYGLRDALHRRIVPNKFNDQFDKPFRSVGVVGHRGAGKTTLVRSAIAKLKDQHQFTPIVIDALAVLDQSDFAFADVILTLVNAVVAELERVGATIPDDELQLVRLWFADELLSKAQSTTLQGDVTTSAELSSGIPLFAKLMAKLSAIVRTDSQTRREIRQHIEREPRELTRRANLLFDAAARAFGTQQLLIVIDNLEKINNRNLVDAAILRRADELHGLRATLI